MPWSMPTGLGQSPTPPMPPSDAAASYYAPRVTAPYVPAVDAQGNLYAPPPPEPYRPTIADSLRGGGFQRGGTIGPIYRPSESASGRTNTWNGAQSLGVFGLIVAATSLTLLILTYTTFSWLNTGSGLFKFGADFSDMRRAIRLSGSLGGSIPADYSGYFGWFSYVLLVACPLLAILANLGLPTGAFKVAGVTLGLLGLAATIEITIHLFVDLASAPSVDVGAGPWLAMLGFALAAGASALGP